MKRMQVQAGIAKPMAEFADLRLIAVIQVLPSAKYFHGRDAGLLHAVQPRDRQTMIDKEMS